MSDMLKRTFFLFFILTIDLFCSYKVGVEEFQMGRYGDSLKSFQRAITKGDNVGNSYYFIGKILMTNENDEKAFQSFVKAFQTEADHPDLVADFGICLNRMASPQFFEDAFREQLFVPPVVYHFAYQLFQKKENEKLISLVERAENNPLFQKNIRVFPENSGMTFYFMARTYHDELKDNLKALDYSRKAIAADSTLQSARSLNRSLLENLRREIEKMNKAATAHFNEQRFDQAREIWAKVLELDSDDVEIRNNMEKCRIAKVSFEALSEAEKLLQEDRKGEAVRKLQFASQYPDNLRAKVLLDKLNKEMAAVAASIEQQARTEEEQRNLFHQWIREAENLLQRDKAADIEQAIEKFKKALAVHPDDEKLQENIQLAEKRLGHRRLFDEAKGLFDARKNKEAFYVASRLEKEDPTFPGLNLLLLSILNELEEFEQVIERGEELLRILPNNRDVLFAVARAYEAKREEMPGARDKAIEKYQLLRGIAPEEAGVELSLSMLKREKYMPLFFVGLFGAIILFIGGWLYKTRDKRRKIAFENRFEALYEKKDFKGLCKLYKDFYSIDFDAQETIRIQPQFMAALVECSEFEEAMDVGRKVLSATPNNKQVLVLMARCCYAKRIFTQGVLRYYIELFNSGTPSPDMVDFVGEKIFELGFESKETLNIMKAFNRLHPEHEKCRHLLLSVYANEKSMDKQMVELMQEEVSHNQTDTKFRLKLADYYLQRKQFDECIRYCEEVINLNVTEKNLHHILFEAYNQQGLLADLAPIYDMLLETCPNDIAIQEVRAKIKLLTEGGAVNEDDDEEYEDEDEDEV
jgi:tetratricopeptide (TPR) repeat protein